MPRKCPGNIKGVPCTFSKVGGPTQPAHGQTRCVWCEPHRLERASGSTCGRARLAQLLRGMPEVHRDLALRRLPADAHEEHFEAEFGAQFKDPFCAVGSDLSMDSEDDAEMALLSEAELEFDAGDHLHPGGHLEQGMDDELDAAEKENAAHRTKFLAASAPEAEDFELPVFEPEPFEDWIEASSNNTQEEPGPQPKKRPASRKAGAKSKANARIQSEGKGTAYFAARKPLKELFWPNGQQFYRS